MFILVHKDTNICYDVVETIFPVHESLEWVDITNTDPQPAHGWYGYRSQDNNSWVFQQEPQ